MTDDDELAHDDQLIEYQYDDDGPDPLRGLRGYWDLRYAATELREREARDRISAAQHKNAWLRQQAEQEAERAALLARARRLARYQRETNAQAERKDREQRRETDALHAAYEARRISSAAAAEAQRQRELARQQREARAIEHRQAMIEADANPLDRSAVDRAHDAMMRESPDPAIAAKYLGPYDRVGGSVVSRSGELPLIRKKTERASPPAAVAVLEATEVIDPPGGDDYLPAFVDEYVTAALEDVGAALQARDRKIKRLEHRLAKLERTTDAERKSAVELPNPLKYRTHVPQK
jgi:hypothetical protein